MKSQTRKKAAAKGNSHKKAAAHPAHAKTRRRGKKEEAWQSPALFSEEEKLYSYR